MATYALVRHSWQSTLIISRLFCCVFNRGAVTYSVPNNGTVEMNTNETIRSNGRTLTIVDDLYAMVGPTGTHTLLVAATSDARLRAHWIGFGGTAASLVGKTLSPKMEETLAAIKQAGAIQYGASGRFNRRTVDALQTRGLVVFTRIPGYPVVYRVTAA